MKKALLITTLSMFGGLAWAQDFTAHQRVAPKEHPTNIVVQPATDGAIQKAVRTGAPLQMINPFAPREYGDGSECVYYDEHDHFQNRNSHQAQPKGIRLFAFTF